jgi:hypothetical protein
LPVETLACERCDVAKLNEKEFYIINFIKGGYSNMMKKRSKIQKHLAKMVLAALLCTGGGTLPD